MTRIPKKVTYTTLECHDSKKTQCNLCISSLFGVLLMRLGATDAVNLLVTDNIQLAASNLTSAAENVSLLVAENIHFAADNITTVAENVTTAVADNINFVAENISSVVGSAYSLITQKTTPVSTSAYKR